MQGAEDFLDLLGQHQGGQMEHDAGAQAGADVGRAGGEIAEFLAEGIGDAFLELVVEAVGVLPGFVEGEAGADHLQAEVVLLVDHDADDFVGGEGDAARPLAVGQLAADELAFDEELAIERRQTLARLR